MDKRVLYEIIIDFFKYIFITVALRWHFIVDPWDVIGTIFMFISDQTV